MFVYNKYLPLQCWKASLKYKDHIRIEQLRDAHSRSSAWTNAAVRHPTHLPDLYNRAISLMGTATLTWRPPRPCKLVCDQSAHEASPQNSAVRLRNTTIQIALMF